MFPPAGNYFRKAPQWFRSIYCFGVLYPSSWLSYAVNRRTFSDLKAYAMFMGYPRSGHSLIGALLNAHPHALIAHELNASRFVVLGFRRQQIFALLRMRDQWFGKRGRQWGRYDYEVSGGAQGSYDSLAVIADKKGGGLTDFLAEYPDLFTTTRCRIGLPIRVIHNVRNPYDNIAAMADARGRSTAKAFAHYEGLVRTVETAIGKLSEDELLQQWHEDFVGDVKGHITALCGFVGLEVETAYLDACADRVFESPNRSRDKVVWTRADVDRVEALCRDVSFLRRYSGTAVTIEE